MSAAAVQPREAFEYLDGLISCEHTGRLENPTTERIAALVAALGDPHRRYPSIHVTGTNGKGSTTTMISNLLRGQGLRVGTYTSPHVERLGERISVDGRPATDQELARAIGRVAQAAVENGITPSWFEAVTAVGLWLFAERAIDVAVVEVGMLGRWDATNVVDGAVAVVTNVQLDHTDEAGPTRAAIAKEKAGIIKKSATLILGEQDPALRPIFEAENAARILTEGRELVWRNRAITPSGSVVDLINPWGARHGVHIGMIGEHQCDNALLALSAAEAFSGTAIPTEAVDRALAATRVPGRFEVLHRDPTVVMDGAHNPAGAGALRAALDEVFTQAQPRILVYGALRGRDPIEFLDRLGLDHIDLIVATEPDSPRALPASVLVEAARGFAVPATVVTAPERALETAMAAAGERGAVIATGSLYLMGPLRGLVKADVLAGSR